VPLPPLLVGKMLVALAACGIPPQCGPLASSGTTVSDESKIPQDAPPEQGSELASAHIIEYPSIGTEDEVRSYEPASGPVQEDTAREETTKLRE
jgi:hypothetical protein